MKNKAVLSQFQIYVIFLLIIAWLASVVIRALALNSDGPSSSPCLASSFFQKSCLFSSRGQLILQSCVAKKRQNLRLKTACYLTYVE